MEGMGYMSNVEGERLMAGEEEVTGDRYKLMQADAKAESRSLISTNNRLLPRGAAIMASVADLSQKIEALRDKIRGVLPASRPTIVKLDAAAPASPQGLPSTFDATERQLAAAHKTIAELHEMF
jgi:hypothetical protein